MDLPETPPSPKEVSKSKIPVPSSLYVQAGRSTFLADLSDRVYCEEEKELEEAKLLGKRKKRSKSKRRSGGGGGDDDDSEEDTIYSEDDFDYFGGDGYGPPGILHTGKRKKGKLRKKPSSELGDSSIELLGPSASLETDESNGTGDLVTESLEDDDGRPRESRSATGFRRYSMKKGERDRRKEYKKSRTVGGGGVEEEEFYDGKHLSPTDRDRGYQRYGERKGGSKERQRDGSKKTPSPGSRERRGDGGGRGQGGEHYDKDKGYPDDKRDKDYERYGERRGGERRKEKRSPDPTGKSPGRGGDGGRKEGGRKSGERDVNREEKGDKSYQRYGEKGDTRRDRSKGTPGKSPRRDSGGGDIKEKKRKSQGKDKTTDDKWARQPGRDLSSASGAGRTPSKSPSKSKSPGDKGRSPKPSRSKDDKEGLSPRKYESKDPDSKEKVEKWAKENAKRTGIDQERAEGRKKAQQASVAARGDKWARTQGKLRKPGEKPGDSGDDKDSDSAGGDGRKDRKKRAIKGDPGGVAWDPKERYDPEEEWNIDKASKPPIPKMGAYAEGLDPAELAEKLKVDEARDTAARMRLLQLCQSGDWYGVDGHMRYFEKRIQAGLTLNTKPLADLKDEGTGWTPLMYAIKDNRIPVADRLLDLGCDVNAVTKEGYTALHMSALHGKDDTIRFLLYKKADLTAVTDGKNQNVLHIACTRGQVGNSASILRIFLQAPKRGETSKRCRRQYSALHCTEKWIERSLSRAFGGFG